MGKQKYSAQTKIAACEDYLTGRKKVSQICRELGLSNCNAPGCFWNWVRRYKMYGKEAFSDEKKKKRYTEELKKEVVQAYLDGKGSFGSLAVQYGVTTDEIIRSWYWTYKDELKNKES